MLMKKMQWNNKRKCKNYDVIEKIKILEELNENVSTEELAQQYNVDARTIRNWKKNRSKLEEFCKKNIKGQRKRQRKLPFELVEKALLIWFEEMRVRCIPLNGPLIKEKAVQLAKEINMSKNFIASEGWLNQWKFRNDIRTISICGEKKSADVEAAEKFKKNLEEDITLAQIFNADETDLNYKMLPHRTLAKAEEHEAFGFKQSKDRVTVMVCCNADGSLKLPLVIIGKSAKPRKLKNISKNVLPAYYTNQKSAWMNSDIFKKWFKDEFVPRVSAFLKEKKLSSKVILYLDNTPCHPIIETHTLSVNDIKICYLPPNTTSLIQPMDQGIIENIKRHYRSQLLTNALNAQQDGIDIMTFLKSISIREVIYWISDAWASVHPAMINKCWKNLLPAKYFGHKNDDKETDSALEFTITDNYLLNNIQKLHNYQDITEDDVWNWIMKNDNNITPIPSNADIVQMATKNNESESETDHEENVTPQETISALDKVISFHEKNNVFKANEFAVLRKCKNIVIQLKIQ